MEKINNIQILPDSEILEVILNHMTHWFSEYKELRPALISKRAKDENLSANEVALISRMKDLESLGPHAKNWPKAGGGLLAE